MKTDPRAFVSAKNVRSDANSALSRLLFATLRKCNVVASGLIVSTVLLLLWIGQAAILFAQTNSSAATSFGANPIIEKRIDDLLAQMTLEEKTQLLRGDGNMTSLGIKRLGIPGIRMSDSPQGVRWDTPATVFPSPVLMGATWDPELIRRVGVALGEELRAEGRDMLLGPCVNIHRSPLGGRTTESYSEDPFLMSRMAVAYVQGVQSKGTAAACVKHFAAHNQDTRRLSVNVEADPRFLNEIEFPAFRAAVQEAGAMTIMSAYNSLNGRFCFANSYLLTQVLRDTWNFHGLIISDWGTEWSIPEPARTIDPMIAGLDVNMPDGYGYGDALVQAVKNGTISETLVDEKVRYVLRFVFALHIDDPDRNHDALPIVSTPEHQQLAREVADDGIVLLKNDGQILPLDRKNLHSIAVIGPNADVARLGDRASAFVPPPFTVSPLDALQKRLGSSIKINFNKGFEVSNFQPIPSSAFLPPSKSAAANGLRGEYFASKDPSEKPVSTRLDANIDFKLSEDSAAAVGKSKEYSARWSGQIVAPKSGIWFLGLQTDGRCELYLDGRLFLETYDNKPGVIKSIGIQFEKDEPRDIVLEFHNAKGQGKINLVWAPESPTPFAAAVKIASESDVAIILAGLDTDYEGEGLDRFNMQLPALQDDLIQAVRAANPRTIVVINSGTPNDLRKWIQSVPAVLQAWYPGMEGGNALADVLLGDVNPSGKLPDTFGKRREDYADWGNFPGQDDTVKYAEGIFVGYRHFDAMNIDPLFPFGYGLSYTTFTYKNLSVASSAGQVVDINFDIQNTGKREGSEIAQLYVANTLCPLPHAPKELKAFQKVPLAPGEAKHIHLHLDRSSFSYFDPHGSGWTFLPGQYEILIGSSSRDIREHQSVEVR
jgi:beta-glucosidase